jgi:hypothetical protein
MCYDVPHNEIVQILECQKSLITIKKIAVNYTLHLIKLKITILTLSVPSNLHNTVPMHKVPGILLKGSPYSARP